jgi:hypothetical protein
MALQDNEILLNNVLIGMARSFLQYVAECWPWVSSDGASIEARVRGIAADQRADVSEIVQLLMNREHVIDFGSFPTEYTDLHFMSLQNLMDLLKGSQQLICRQLGDAAESLRTAGDAEGAKLLAQIQSHQQDAARALSELQLELRKTVPSTVSR